MDKTMPYLFSRDPLWIIGCTWEGVILISRMPVARLSHLEIPRGSLCKLLMTIKTVLILSATSFRIKARLIALWTLTLCLHNLP
uniref:Uncharacterized protein n=1 Tax=Arundo donax TaxID=35708 RepID=A0A0A9EBN9_ARUDO